MVVRLQSSRFRTLALPVLVGVAGIALILYGLMRPLPSYLVAARDLVPGETISADSVTSVNLDLGPLAQLYLNELTPGVATSDFVAAGELIPKRLLGDSLLPSQTLMRIIPQTQPASTVQPGTLVSIWQVIELEESIEAQPLVEVAEVVKIIEPDGLFASENPQLEILLSKSQAAAVIRAIASEVPIFVMPTA